MKKRRVAGGAGAARVVKIEDDGRGRRGKVGMKYKNI